MRRYPTTLLVAAWLLAGCGTAAPTSVAPAKTPAARRLELRSDRIVVRGDYAPDERGPLTLDGRYRATFTQRGDDVDFAGEVPFTAHLTQQRASGTPRTVKLFQRAARTGAATLTAHGRWTLDIDFGDSPFEVVLTRVG